MDVRVAQRLRHHGAPSAWRLTQHHLHPDSEPKPKPEPGPVWVGGAPLRARRGRAGARRVQRRLRVPGQTARETRSRWIVGQHAMHTTRTLHGGVMLGPSQPRRKWVVHLSPDLSHISVAGHSRLCGRARARHGGRREHKRPTAWELFRRTDRMRTVQKRATRASRPFLFTPNLRERKTLHVTKDASRTTWRRLQAEVDRLG